MRPADSQRTHQPGNGTAAGSLSLTDAELDRITAGILRIGSTDAGSITFNATISPALTDTLSLITGDAILDTNGKRRGWRFASLAGLRG
ncbi:MAG: hypothetical protein R3F53_21635 [Gammaproteobacteria bacterium]